MLENERLARVLVEKHGIHIVKGIQENDRLICTKSYRIKGKRKRSRTSAEDRFLTIAR